MPESKKKKKEVKVTLSPQDAKIIAETAERLGITETEVLRKGLKIMDVFAQGKEEKAKLMIQKEKDNTIQELLII